MQLGFHSNENNGFPGAFLSSPKKTKIKKFSIACSSSTAGKVHFFISLIFFFVLYLVLAVKFASNVNIQLYYDEVLQFLMF